MSGPNTSIETSGDHHACPAVQVDGRPPYGRDSFGPGPGAPYGRGGPVRDGMGPPREGMGPGWDGPPRMGGGRGGGMDGPWRGGERMGGGPGPSGPGGMQLPPPPPIGSDGAGPSSSAGVQEIEAGEIPLEPPPPPVVKPLGSKSGWDKAPSAAAMGPGEPPLPAPFPNLRYVVYVNGG